MKKLIFLLTLFALPALVQAQEVITLKAVSGSGTVKVPIGIAGTTTTPAVKPVPEEPKPAQRPIISVANTKVEQSTVDFMCKAQISSESPLKNIVFEVNGKQQTTIGKPTFRGDDKQLTQQLQLTYGENTVHIRAQNQAGESTAEIKVFVSLEHARAFALIIGVSEYSDPSIQNLKGFPTRDADQLAELLSRNYLFEEPVVLHNPTRTELLSAWIAINDKARPQDKLLVFYAGHGSLDHSIDKGAWWPADAKKGADFTYVTNDEIINKAQQFPGRHVLLINDACFGGSILSRSGGDAVPPVHPDIEAKASRRAITSGAPEEKVPNNSEFFSRLYRTLAANPNAYLTSRQLFARILEGWNAGTRPQDGALPGDRSGDFIFIKRRN